MSDKELINSIQKEALADDTRIEARGFNSGVNLCKKNTNFRVSEFVEGIKFPDEIRAEQERIEKEFAAAQGFVNSAKTESRLERQYDPVHKPRHYNVHPSGIECIQVTEHMGFNLGNALKYVWRADEKNGIEDLEKAKWYVEREIKLRRNKASE